MSAVSGVDASEAKTIINPFGGAQVHRNVANRVVEMLRRMAGNLHGHAEITPAEVQRDLAVLSENGRELNEGNLLLNTENRRFRMEYGGDIECAVLNVAVAFNRADMTAEQYLNTRTNGELRLLLEATKRAIAFVQCELGTPEWKTGFYAPAAPARYNNLSDLSRFASAAFREWERRRTPRVEAETVDSPPQKSESWTIRAMSWFRSLFA
ncbi:hypothetical protein HY632_01745 [Candidatus Uhrbacteria bacterium]|nr:hypothetical protein [Candidatus Uhrbacteria bacterium]